MYISERPLIFLCSGAAKAGNKKLSYRIASLLVSMGLGEIGTLSDLSRLHATKPDERQKMLFINDCKSGCVNVLTHGFDTTNYIFFDISSFLAIVDFNAEHYITTEMLPQLNKKWPELFGDAQHNPVLTKTEQLLPG